MKLKPLNPLAKVRIDAVKSKLDNDLLLCRVIYDIVDEDVFELEIQRFIKGYEANFIKSPFCAYMKCKFNSLQECRTHSDDKCYDNQSNISRYLNMSLYLSRVAYHSRISLK